MAGPEAAKKYQNLIFLAGSASAEFFADIALCPMEAVKVGWLRVLVPGSQSEAGSWFTSRGPGARQDPRQGQRLCMGVWGAVPSAHGRAALAAWLLQEDCQGTSAPCS